MKVPPSQLEAFVEAPPANIRAFLLFGSDRGLITNHASKLAFQIVPDDTAFPFNRVRLETDDLKQEQSRISDELAATTLMGGRRVVSCIGFGDDEREAIEKALEASQGSNNRLIVTTGDLKRTSKLRKLFEIHDDCAVLACYADENRDLTQLIRTKLGAAGMEADRDALAALTANLGADRSLSLRELEKLILYKGQPGPVTAEDVRMIVADASPLALDTYLYALTGGNLVMADATLQRLLNDGQTPVRIHIALTQHLARFAEVLEAKNNVNQAVQALRPPLFWKVRDTFVQQAYCMQITRLMTAVRLTHVCGLDFRLSALPADVILSRLTLRLSYLFA